jgi:hypothetical protein
MVFLSVVSALGWTVVEVDQDRHETCFIAGVLDVETGAVNRA